MRIGRAITEALEAEGVDIIVHFRTSEKEAKAASPNIIQADLNDPAQCEILIDRAADQFGPIDILVNNAAVFHACRLLDTTPDELQRELQPNLFAPLALIRGFAKQNRASKIINLLDRRVTAHDTGYVPYMLSKKGLEELTKLAALELAPAITVNAVAPGAVLPPPDHIGNTAWEPAGTIPLDRRPTPQDIADAVVFLLKADTVTGQTLFVDSGQHLCP